jgi:hypothetical protein
MEGLFWYHQSTCYVLNLTRVWWIHRINLMVGAMDHQSICYNVYQQGFANAQRH